MRRILSAIALASVCAACSTPQPPTAAAAAPARAIAQPDPSSLPTPAPCADEGDWSEPTAPRHVFGNTWYVGTCGITVLLIATPQGHVLIDAATDRAAAGILANLHALGVNPRDVRYLLASHAHLDHAGGMAQLQAATGATLLALPTAVDVYRRGRGDRSDPQFDSIPGFTPVAHVRAIADGQTLELGPLRLTAHATPGRTPGSTSWSWDSCEAGQCRHLVYADSVSAISDDTYRYGDHPDAVAAFRHGLETLAALPCDILVTPHPGASRLWPRLRGEAPLLDSAACKAYAGKGQAGLDARLAKEKTGAAP